MRTCATCRQGSQQLTPYVSGSPFVPYDQLTKPMVEGWLLDAMGASSYNTLTASVDYTLEQAAIPPTSISLPPPWTTGSVG